jgi:four helix bundle protein
MDIELLAELSKWEESVSPVETGDPLWKLHAYRVSRYLLHCCLEDIRDAAPPVHLQTADQLRRAVASISANLAEGYSRRTPNDRVRFYSYALGSIREATVWYATVNAHMPTGRLQHRMELIAQVRRLLLGMLNSINRAGAATFRR